MAVVCEDCAHRAERLYYEAPPKMGREVRLFLGLAVACGLLGVYHLSVLLFDVIPIVDKADELGVGSVTIPGSRLALLRDVVQLYNNSTRYFLTVMLLALTFVPARNLRLVISSLNARPRALPSLRRILGVQFGIEFVSTTALWALGYKLEVIQIPFHFGFNLIVAPIALAASMRAAVKAHYSAHRFEPLARPATPAPAA